LLSDLHAQGRTIVMVTHDENAGKLADRRLNLDHGRIKETLVFSAEENQDFDEVLEHMWTAARPAATSTHEFTEVQWRKLDCNHGAHRPRDHRTATAIHGR
jgi:ABC-type proline/glycine betaine transport system ATPase subunit